MPFNTILDPIADVVIHEGHGLISDKEIRAELSACFGESGWTHHSLWDLRDASLKLLTAEQVHTLAELAKNYALKRAGMKNAWVATSCLDFGLCRMSEFFADGAGLQLGVFQDYDKAMAWIKA
jgi:hypothetical protein